MRDFAKTLKNEKKSGTYNHYVSIDTQMLAMLLQEVTGKSITLLLQKNIWDKIGMEHDAYYMLDRSGMEVALGGLNASLRDYAKFGLLYLNKGNWKGEQIVPAEWVKASHTPDGKHLLPGENDPNSPNWTSKVRSPNLDYGLGIVALFSGTSYPLFVPGRSAISRYQRNDSG